MIPPKVYQPLQKSLKLVREGDICLFRGPHFVNCIPQPAFFISYFTGSPYTHVGYITQFKQPYMIEFKEFQGFRENPLIYAFDEYNEVDIFRIKIGDYKPHKVIAELRRLSGHNYGWRSIYRLIKWRLFLWHQNPILVESYVCSSAIAHALQKTFMDPVPFKPVEYVTPADLSRCALFEYLFTIRK